MSETTEAVAPLASNQRGSKGKSKPKSYLGVMTRHREKRMREEEERVKRGMGKLVETGKNLIGSEEEDDYEGEFSEYDLIGNRVVEPEVFTEPRTPPPRDHSLVVIPKQEQPDTGESGSIWNLSINPFSGYFRSRTEGNVPNSNEGQEMASGSIGTGTRRVESITDDTCENPQGTSTPN